MKFKSLLLTFLLTIASLQLFADGYATAGFCDNTGSIDDKTEIELTSSPYQYSGAIFLSADDLARFTNPKIHGLNVGLGSGSRYGVEQVEVWIRTDLDGANLASGVKTSKFSKWEALFDAPFDAAANTGYYVGYTVTVKQAKTCVSCQPNIKHTGSHYLKKGNGAWEDKSATAGVLTVEALVSADNLPQNDLTLVSATFVNAYFSKDIPLQIKYKVKNSGLSAVTSFKVTLEDAAKDISQSFNKTCNIENGKSEEYTQEFTIENPVAGYYNFTLKIEMPNNVADQVETDNAIVMDHYKYSLVYKRTVVMEKFTTEVCQYCPPADVTIKAVHDALTEEEQERLAIVCHHAGYYTDYFTKPCDEEYLILYGGGLSAPKMMLDRIPAGGSPVRGFPSSENLVKEVRQRMAEASSYSIEVKGDVDRTKRTVSLEIDMEKAANVLSDARIVVYLVEDNVLASSNGQGQSNGPAPYYHNHIKRDYNSTWGEKITWNENDKAKYTCTLKYPLGCKTKDMEIVAMISNYGGSDITNYEVGNAVKVKLTSLNMSGAEPTITIDNPIVTIDGEVQQGADVETEFVVKASDLINDITFQAKDVQLNPERIAKNDSKLAEGVTVRAAFKAAFRTGAQSLTVNINSDDAESKAVTIKYTVGNPVAVDEVLVNTTVWSENGVILADGEYDTIEVFDLSGRRIDNRDLAAGVYIVKISADETTVTKKVLVK